MFPYWNGHDFRISLCLTVRPNKLTLYWPVSSFNTSRFIYLSNVVFISSSKVKCFKNETSSIQHNLYRVEYLHWSFCSVYPQTILFHSEKVLCCKNNCIVYLRLLLLEYRNNMCVFTITPGLTHGYNLYVYIILNYQWRVKISIKKLWLKILLKCLTLTFLFTLKHFNKVFYRNHYSSLQSWLQRYLPNHWITYMKYEITYLD